MLIKAKCGTRTFNIDSCHVAMIIEETATGGISLRSSTGAELVTFAPGGYNNISSEECAAIASEYKKWCGS
jgi:hypothetical protein